MAQILKIFNVIIIFLFIFIVVTDGITITGGKFKFLIYFQNLFLYFIYNVSFLIYYFFNLTSKGLSNARVMRYVIIECLLANFLKCQGV